MGRFINADSQINANSAVGCNLFAYCNNNPVMFVDPTGHSLVAILGMGVLFLGMVFGLSSSTPQSDNVMFSGNDNYIDPGQVPPPESGYIPPKKNPNPGKVKNPNGQGSGWPANDGGVWVPNNNQDGGPGWTVQYPGGGHEHRYPNGHVRTHRMTLPSTDYTNVLIGGTIIVGGGIGIIILIADDATGVGLANNAIIPVLFGAIEKGVQMVNG